MNRTRTRINWMFDRKAARRKFGYKRKSSTRSKTYSGLYLLNSEGGGCGFGGAGRARSWMR